MRAPRAKSLSLKVEVLPHARDLPLPAIQSSGAAGLDLIAALPADAPLTVKPRARALVPTGLRIEVPFGYEAQIRPRSGLAVKHGITVLNSPGTIDSDYRGEVQVLLINHGAEPFVIRRGERIAQMVVAAHANVRLVPTAALSATGRGAAGFGSTGRASAKTAAQAVKKPKRPASPKRKPAK